MMCFLVAKFGVVFATGDIRQNGFENGCGDKTGNAGVGE
jgi:hypothetical protein